MGLEIRKRLFAHFYDRLTAGYEERMAPVKRPLLEGLEGTGVEIGPGTGANLSLLPPGVRWIGVEPNRHMHPRLRERARGLGVEVDLRRPEGERLPLDDGSVDFAVSTLVLCSVPDPDRTLAELRRVLRPGGRLVFWEHVAAPRGTRVRRVQDLLAPLWRFYADGCRLNRDLGAAVRGAGFREVALEGFEAPADVAPPFVQPHVRGTAVK